MSQFSRYDDVVVDLTDRGHGRRKANVREVYGSNRVHDYLVAFPDGGSVRRVRVTESQLEDYDPSESSN